MKHCENCGRDVAACEEKCPHCAAPLSEQKDGELTEEELVAAMMMTGLR